MCIGTEEVEVEVDAIDGSVRIEPEVLYDPQVHDAYYTSWFDADTFTVQQVRPTAPALLHGLRLQATRCAHMLSCSWACCDARLICRLGHVVYDEHNSNNAHVKRAIHAGLSRRNATAPLNRPFVLPYSLFSLALMHQPLLEKFAIVPVLHKGKRLPGLSVTAAVDDLQAEWCAS